MNPLHLSNHVYIDLCFCFSFLHAVCHVRSWNTHPTSHVVNIRFNLFRLSTDKETQPGFSSLFTKQVVGSSHSISLSQIYSSFSHCGSPHGLTHIGWTPVNCLCFKEGRKMLFLPIARLQTPMAYSSDIIAPHYLTLNPFLLYFCPLLLLFHYTWEPHHPTPKHTGFKVRLLSRCVKLAAY